MPIIFARMGASEIFVHEEAEDPSDEASKRQQEDQALALKPL